MTTAAYILDVLGQASISPAIARLQSNLAGENSQTIEFKQKDFKSVSYRSSQLHGISLQFEQREDDENSDTNWECKAVDIYNQDAVKGWSPYPKLPVNIELIVEDGKSIVLHLALDTTGVDLVKSLGEPHRKGGGEPMKGGGASGLGPGAWMEWNCKSQERPITVMVELAGQDARGKDRWEKERAGAAVWGVCTIAMAE